MLTQKQELFAQNVVAGMTLAEAYHSAYDTKSMSDKTVYEKASLLASQDKIRTRIQELRDRIADEKIMSAQKRLEWLTKVIQNDEESTGDRLRAIDLMNKMQGEYIQKIAAEVQAETTINIELVDDDE
jgi:phage terminase small subunit